MRTMICNLNEAVNIAISLLLIFSTDIFNNDENNG